MQDTVLSSPALGASRHAVAARILSVDILRGAVMILMALDHARDFWSPATFLPDDVTKTSVLLFFTRWVTHFCAPTFVFLSGVSIYLQQQRLNDRMATSWYLLKRGVWLIVMELTVVNVLMQFGIHIIFVQVIWAIGWGMIGMAALLWTPRWFILMAALVVIGGHNLFVDVMPVTMDNAWLAVLHNSPFMLQFPSLPPVLVTYALLPWMAVTAAGYTAGVLFDDEAARRNRVLRLLGIVALVLFMVLRAMNVYGDPNPWSVQERGWVYTVLSFLAVTKYPPSLLFLLLTLGGSLLLLSVTENLRGRVVDIVRTFGAVPFFYYLLHMPLLSGGAIAWAYMRFHMLTILAFLPAAQLPPDYEPSLVRTYVVWFVALVVLYFPCRWYARFKREHADRNGWLTYL